MQLAPLQFQYSYDMEKIQKRCTMIPTESWPQNRKTEDTMGQTNINAISH